MNEGWSQLDQTLAKAAGRRIPVFFRDDDAAEDRPALRRLLTLFESKRVPINLEVIPGLLTDDGTRMLREAVARHPELIGINQHGWCHENHETTGRKCEFGPSRDYERQMEDIRTGRRLLEERFGSAFFPVFTPPWNRCTETTHRVLIELGFRAISDIRTKSESRVSGIDRIPATLDIIDWKMARDLRPVAVLLRELADQIIARGTIGILLHHQVMSDAAFDFIARLLDKIVGSDAIVCHSFQSLLRDYRDYNE